MPAAFSGTLAVSLALSIALPRFLTQPIHSINGPLTLALAAGVLGTAAACAGYFPARRAALAPIAARREE